MRTLLLIFIAALTGPAWSQPIPWDSAQTFVVDAAGKAAGKAEFVPVPGLHADILVIDVPLNRSKPNGETVQLPVLRLRSSASLPAPPLVYLAGGPGDSAIGSRDAEYLAPLIAKALETRDVVLMDQRGTGLARPTATWTSFQPLPTDVFLSEEAALAAMRARHEQAKAVFDKRNLDLSGFTTVEAADDINALRVALGVDKISLLAFSYGTHLALATLRRHGEHIDRAVLVGTEGLNDTFKLPSAYDAQLDKLTAVVAKNSTVGNHVPDMKASWQRILTQAEAEPFRVKVTSGGKEVELPIGKFGLQWIIRRDLGDTNDLPNFPALFHALEQGDVSLLQPYVERRYNQYGRGVSGMSQVTNLASGATADRLAQIEREAPTALFGNAMNFPDLHLREIWNAPDLGDAFRQPVRTDVPTLFVSGTLDCQTPPEQAEAARAGFSRSAHIIVENAGHESLLPHPDVQKRVIAFLNGQELPDERLKFDLKFRPIRTPENWPSRSNRPHSKAVFLALNVGIDALSEAPHFLDGPHGGEINDPKQRNGLEFLAGNDFHRFPHVFGNDDLVLRGYSDCHDRFMILLHCIDGQS